MPTAMSWPASLAVGVLTAAAGALVAAVVASLVVDWYRVSGFEGGSAYFVVGFGLLGLVAGGVLGLVVARVVAAGAHPGFVRAQVIALGAIVGIALVAGGTARALADVPPTLDGETLLLAVEVRWPAGQPLPPADDTSDARLSLGSVGRFSRVERASKVGPLWRTDARVEDGRWVMPGAIELFTNRGVRVLVVELDARTHVGFRLPMGGAPRRADLRWSPWLPRARADGGAAAPGGLTYRYRVQRRSESVRAETIGPFEVRTIASRFDPDRADDRSVVAATASFAVRHGGAPVPVTGVASVAVIAGPRPALLVVGDHGDAGSGCQLLVADGPRVRVERVADCGGVSDAQPITADASRFPAALTPRRVRGNVDRTTFDTPGLYLVHDMLLDTRTLTVRHVAADSSAYPVASLPPLSLSPDGRSFVRLTSTAGADGRMQLTVFDVLGDGPYSLPIDTAHAHAGNLEGFDPAWLARHFVWRRGSGGVDRLVARDEPGP